MVGPKDSGAVVARTGRGRAPRPGAAAPTALRALVTAAVQPLIRRYAFLPAAFDFRLTIRPALFFIRSLFFSPVFVFWKVPLKTLTLARFPFAITLFFMAFRAFIAARMAFAISWDKGACVWRTSQTR